jgi:hypothetical protein
MAPGAKLLNRRPRYVINLTLNQAARCVVVAAILASTAQGASAKPFKHHVHAKMVAYDAKDRKYYSVDYARAHGMHDRGGDLLIVIPRWKLPKDAKLSHAMHGVEP